MTNLRSAADEILAEGALARGEYDPGAGTWPTKVYNTYYRKPWSGDRPDKDNFCHFYRVVLIWSWLAPVLYGLAKVVEGFFWLVKRFASPVYHYFESRPDMALRRGGRATGRFFKRHGEKIFLGLMYSLMAVGIALLLIMLVVGVVTEGWIVLFAVLGGLLVFGLIFAVVFFTVDFIESRRPKSAIKMLADNEITYSEYLEIRNAEKAPSRGKRAWDAVIDFFVLVGNIIRVNKWKICPFVNVPKA